LTIFNIAGGGVIAVGDYRRSCNPCMLRRTSARSTGSIATGEDTPVERRAERAAIDPHHSFERIDMGTAAKAAKRVASVEHGEGRRLLRAEQAQPIPPLSGPRSLTPPTDQPLDRHASVDPRAAMIERRS
jgi:hypothetical protein